MKTVLGVALLLFYLTAHAACKCNCLPFDRSICASNYDLEHPCVSICPGQTAAGFAPMITACTISKAIDSLTGKVLWISSCGEDLKW